MSANRLPTLEYADPTTRSQRRWKGTLIGLSFALLLLAFALLLPAFNSRHPRPPRARCASNLRQIGQGILLYAIDNQGRFPRRLSQLHTDADLASETFVCPESGSRASVAGTKQQVVAELDDPAHCSYIYLGAEMTAAVSPGTIICYENPLNHSEGGMNVLYADGHVEWLGRTEAQRVLGYLLAGRNPPPPATMPAR